MSTGDIHAHLRELYCIEISPELVLSVTDAVLDEVSAWQARPLEAAYAIVFSVGVPPPGGKRTLAIVSANGCLSPSRRLGPAERAQTRGLVQQPHRVGVALLVRVHRAQHGHRHA